MTEPLIGTLFCEPGEAYGYSLKSVKGNVLLVELVKFGMCKM